MADLVLSICVMLLQNQARLLANYHLKNV